MKIAIISRDEKVLAELGRLVGNRNPADDVDAHSGPLEQLYSAQELPDVLMFDRPGNDGADLAAIERLSNQFPRLAVILLCPQHSPDFLLQAMRAGVREVLPSPAAAASIYPALERIEEKLERRDNGNGKVLAFISCKGGSGATFIATNLGYALAASGHKRVALLDLNLHFGDASLFVSESKPLATLADVTRDIHRLDPSFLASSMLNVLPNFSVLAAPEDPAHASEVLPEHIDAIIKLARRQYDFIVLDVGRNLDAVSVRTLDHADMIFPVLQATLPYIRDGKRLLQAFHSLEYPASKIHLILNRHTSADEIRGRDLEAAYGQQIFHAMPNHYAVAAASVNQGVPVLKLAPGSPLAKSLQECARKLGGTRAASTPGLFSRLFQRSRPIQLRGETA